MSIPESRSTSERIRILAISDSESYLKWATQLLTELPDIEAEVCLLDTPILPTPEQISHAVAGTAWAGRDVPIITRAQLASTIGRHRPDIVLGAATGPVVAQVFLSVQMRERRPALVSGLPGIGLPAGVRGMNYRRLMDAFIVHSTAEEAAYTEASAQARVPCEILLARLPMLRTPGRPQLAVPAPEAENSDARMRSDVTTSASVDRAAGVPRSLVFAPQAKVPEPAADRKAVISALAEFAARHPESTTVIKMRSRPGEFETHHEQHSYYSILESYREKGVRGADLIEIGYGPLEKFLVPGSALVTVSSTAALESIDRGIPTLLVSDFGFRPELLNEVFADSGATGTLAEVATGSIGFPSAPWLERNYFQPVSTDLRRRLGLLAARARAGQLPNRRSAALKQKRVLVRAELRTLAPASITRAYRKLRRSHRARA